MGLDERVYNLGKELAVMKAEYDHLNEILEINLKEIEKRMGEFDKSLNKKFDFIGNIASFSRKMIAISSLVGIIGFFISGSALDYLIKHIDSKGHTRIINSKY